MGAPVIDTDLFNDFLNLAQSRNFSTTARARGMSQSTLSRRIAQLETFVGAPLFDRAIHPVALTETGENLLPLAQDVLEQMQRIHALGHPESQRRNEQCTLISLSSLAMNFFPGWLSQQQQDEHWRVNLLNTEPVFAANLRLFLHGHADFLLTFGSENVADLHALRHHRYVVLGMDTAYPVSAPDDSGRPRWLLQGPGPVNYCAYSKGSFMQQALAELMAEVGPWLHKVRENSMAAVLYSMVRQGHGMSWLPGIQIGPDLQDGTLVLAGGPQHSVNIEIRLYRSHNMGRYAQRFWSSVSASHQVRRRALPSG